MYELDFSCSSIFHQLWTHIGYFKGKKDQLIFHPFLAIFYCQADLQMLQRPPKSDSWGFYGGIPSSGTQGSPPNHYWQKSIFKPQNPESHSQPSVLCGIHGHHFWPHFLFFFVEKDTFWVTWSHKYPTIFLLLPYFLTWVLTYILILSFW